MIVKIKITLILFLHALSKLSSALNCNSNSCLVITLLVIFSLIDIRSLFSTLNKTKNYLRHSMTYFGCTEYSRELIPFQNSIGLQKFTFEIHYVRVTTNRFLYECKWYELYEQLPINFKLLHNKNQTVSLRV